MVGKGGPKLKESASDSATRLVGLVSTATVISTFTNSSMDALVNVLAGAADRPVVNETGLGGLYDFKVEFAREPVTDTNAPSLFTAVQEQLGLKLEAKQEPVEFLVIDHAERPSEN